MLEIGALLTTAGAAAGATVARGESLVTTLPVSAAPAAPIASYMLLRSGDGTAGAAAAAGL